MVIAKVQTPLYLLAVLNLHFFGQVYISNPVKTKNVYYFKWNK